MVPPAAERAAEILAASVAGVRQEANPAMAAAYGAVLEIGTIAQNGIQRQLILTNKRVDAVVAVPILVKREDFRDGYDKTARFSVTMWILFGMSSSYYLDANASRSRAGIFSSKVQEIGQLPRTSDPRPSSYLISFS